MKKIYLVSFLFLINFAKSQSVCNNEDFEATAPGTITTVNGITGWSVSSGSNGGATGSCTLANFPSNPNAVTIINTISGYIDPNIGPSYPIYSVFGSNANAGGMFGNSIIKLNDAVPNFGSHKLSKTMAVTGANDLLRIAFINISAGGHSCCDGPMARFQLRDGSNNLIPCPKILDNYTASGCPAIVSYSSCPLNAGMAYHKWYNASFDLSAYIGSNVTLEAIVSDCTAGSHPGYLYFDAQCAPLGLWNNSTFYGYSGPSFLIGTCGSGSTATLTAPPGLGPYSWTGPSGFVPTSSQTMTTNITGNYTLTMTPPGACIPTVWTASLVISPAVNLSATSTSSVLCLGNTATLTSNATSGTPPFTYSWSTGATTSITAVSPTVSTTYTAYVTDFGGCQNTYTLTQNVTVCSGVESFSQREGFLIYPNPSSDYFNLDISKDIENGEIELRNMVGQIVLKQNVKKGTNAIRTNNLSKGIYNYSILENKLLLSKGKLIME